MSTKWRSANATDGDIIEMLLGNKNNLHNNYQDFQAFLDNGGRIGLQHDPLLYGAYALNPFLVSVELVWMLVVQQGQVAVDQGVRGIADARHVRRGFQVRHAGATGASRHLAGGAANRKISAQSALLPGGNRSDFDPDSELGRRGIAGAQSGRATEADCREEQRRIRFRNRSAGADPRAGYERAARDFHGRDHDESGERSFAGRRGQSFPRQIAEHAGDSLHRNAPASAGGGVQAHQGTAGPIPGRDARRLYPGRRAARRIWSRC